MERLDWLAGAPGFEPGNGGIKIRCLTTWLRPTRTGATLTRAAGARNDARRASRARCGKRPRRLRIPSPLAGEGGTHCERNGRVRGLGKQHVASDGPLTFPPLRGGPLPLPQGERKRLDRQILRDRGICVSSCPV